METHDAWCDPKNVAEVMKQVNHPAIGVNWDIMHPVRTGHATIDESFEALKPWIRHLHIHDASKETGKLVPIGQGFIDHRRAIELLLTISYDGYMSGEWINWEDPYEVHLPRELATLKAMSNG
jgi:sugar phosphate isomerase/epimerase